jgi:hypothetical protein
MSSTMPARLLSVFLCHASSDKPSVRALYEKLSKDGFKPWLDEKDLLPGQNWDLEIRKAVNSADVVVVCLSQLAVSKEGYVQREIRLALDAADEKLPGAIFLIPVKLSECCVPERLRQWQWVNLHDTPDGYERLVSSLRVRAKALGRKPKMPKLSTSRGISNDKDVQKLVQETLRKEFLNIARAIPEQKTASLDRALETLANFARKSFIDEKTAIKKKAYFEEFAKQNDPQVFYQVDGPYEPHVNCEGKWQSDGFADYRMPWESRE